MPEPVPAHLPVRLRLLAAMVVVFLVTGLLWAGAMPVAVGLFRAPWDKLAHIVTFAVMGAAFGLAGGLRGWRMLVSCVAGTLAVGAMDELKQLWLPGRSAGWDDLLADALGGLAGGAFLTAGYRWLDGRAPGASPVQRKAA